MITLAQHLAAHHATSKWVDCDGGCGWWAKHTGHPMPACTCGQVSRSDDPTAEHAAHVAATWQQARTSVAGLAGAEYVADVFPETSSDERMHVGGDDCWCEPTILPYRRIHEGATDV